MGIFQHCTIFLIVHEMFFFFFYIFDFDRDFFQWDPVWGDQTMQMYGNFVTNAVQLEKLELGTNLGLKNQFSLNRSHHKICRIRKLPLLFLPGNTRKSEKQGKKNQPRGLQRPERIARCGNGIVHVQHTTSTKNLHHFQRSC